MLFDSVFAFTTLPCFRLACVAVFQVLVVETVPAGSEVECVVVVDWSVVNLRPPSDNVLSLTVVD